MEINAPTSLAALSNLRYHGLQNNHIHSVAGLTDLQDLLALYPGSNSIRSLEGLEGLVNLNVLDIGFTGTIPIAEALYAKGVGIGTVLAFMMAVTALSLPSLVMLSRVVKRRLLVVFVGVVTAGIIAVGYLFNAVGWLWA